MEKVINLRPEQKYKKPESSTDKSKLSKPRKILSNQIEAKVFVLNLMKVKKPIEVLKDILKIESPRIQIILLREFRDELLISSPLRFEVERLLSRLERS